jgi:hypothetical protein
MMSTTAACSAMSIAGRSGAIRIAVPMRTAVVTAATAAANVSGCGR